MTYFRVEQVHNTVVQANQSSYFLAWPTIFMHYVIKVCESFGDIDALITCMNRLNYVIQYTSKQVDFGFGKKTLYNDLNQ